MLIQIGQMESIRETRRIENMDGDGDKCCFVMRNLTYECIIVLLKKEI